jgi:hypothetical protein
LKKESWTVGEGAPDEDVAVTVLLRKFVGVAGLEIADLEDGCLSEVVTALLCLGTRWVDLTETVVVGLLDAG